MAKEEDKKQATDAEAPKAEKKAAKKAAPKKEAKKPTKVKPTAADFDVLKKPVITEKATMAQMNNRCRV